MLKKIRYKILSFIARKLEKYNKKPSSVNISYNIQYVFNPESLKGKVALVLGASSGIGRATAIALAKNGAKVVLAARREGLLKEITQQINKIQPNTSKYVICDVTDIKQIENAVNFTVNEYGKLDVAVNNFGISNDQDIRNLTESSFDQHIQVNTKGIAFAMKYECIVMQNQNTLSSIINIGSTLSLVGMANMASYSASKHAVIGLTKSAVLDRVPNVRINTICPGWVRTSMGGFADNQDKIAVPNVELNYPIGRIGEPEDIANAVVFLASNESSFINGASIPVDGGFICD